ncbi:MAG TPA: amylo-alpha-1,6-glucosidase [Vicinamibacteria bacterium]|nr:amylo-alpha-1,6-glucosidase [Vicinamibacteria bacterium]
MDAREWLEADGLGGFASGTVAGPRTRRYHALLLVAETPPTGRLVLVNGFDAWVETAAGRFALSSQRYGPDLVAPDGHVRLAAFEREPWPQWTFTLPDGARVVQEVIVHHGHPLTALSWRLEPRGHSPLARLALRPFLSGRDYHALHHENPELSFEAEVDGQRVRWRTYASVPAVAALANGHYAHDPHWYRGFLYEEERARGLDHVEDLAAPGTFTFDLAAGEAVLLLSSDASLLTGGAAALLAAIRDRERRRRDALGSGLQRAADAYLVRRGATGRTLVAGYPWFTDWGRDTFIALRGLCLAGGRLQEARAVLLEWAGAVSDGMLPNRFPDRGREPEFNSVDAALWFVVAVAELLRAAGASGADRERLLSAVAAILEGYTRGTRHRIGATADGLLAAGEPGVQLTWMDVKLGDWVVTPRVGKPVEVQALWLNALSLAAEWWPRYREPFARGLAAFRARFWDEARGYLADVVDADHVPGRVDTTLRPNQILAVGGLPVTLLDEAPARRVVQVVEERLLTPLGLRTLAPGTEGYSPRCQGSVQERDASYHRGTVWPWLMGPFVEAWLRVQGETPAAREEAGRFLEPLRAHLEEAGLGHVSEIADGDAPHAPRGCPFQAWSVGELIRAQHLLAAPAPRSRGGGVRLRGARRPA